MIFTENWPRDPANGYLLCTPTAPRPKGAEGRWSHEGAHIVGGCSEGCCDDFECRDCGAMWRREAPQ